MSEVDGLIKALDSPLEERFVKAILRRMECDILEPYPDEDRPYYSISPIDKDLDKKGIDLVAIEVHPPTKCGKKTYYPDFQFVTWQHKTQRGLFLFVEIDGFEFHERTKEQFTYEKQRERALQKLGNPIIRFSGSEAYKSPETCLNEVVDFITARHK